MPASSSSSSTCSQLLSGCGVLHSDERSHSCPLHQEKQDSLAGGQHCEAPKAPCNAYRLFVKNHRPKLSGSLVQVAMQISMLWGNLRDDERQLYEDEAKELKFKYDHDLSLYKRSADYKQQLTELRNRGILCWYESPKEDCAHLSCDLQS